MLNSLGLITIHLGMLFRSRHQKPMLKLVTSPGLGIVVFLFTNLFPTKKQQRLITYFLFRAYSVNELDVGKRQTIDCRQ